jgi:hypothetical protein
MVAVEKRDQESVKVLLAHGADVNAVNTVSVSCGWCVCAQHPSEC